MRWRSACCGSTASDRQHFSEPGFASSFGVADRYGHVVIATGEYPTVGIACCLRSATVAVDEVAAVRSGQPQGDLAPDVYEQAAHRFPL